ncbi:HEPN-associated N-terminal domain-containing protein [Streptomyces sp. B-S-A8]|uniref:HEPN-associated N-terminal domain-containing protein n=1 Tax=Streptomyces solicavernae TaxID=3043614 RepID=A0ABT6RJL2_9ACTN|nr:HEPN-associated N-terminal domain-containing protein [Streptomyces sp. B-S-A8]MDI3384621.1 HEPN-associated N-terminal domain-containing protein [Streptomyces sp. B-S-A8]
MTDAGNGPTPPDDFADSVCRRCVSDDALEALLDEAAEAGRVCSFCAGDQAADFDTFLEAFLRGLHHEFNDVDDEGVSYESREGGYQWSEITDTWDLISDEFGDVLTGDGLVEAVQRHVEDRLWARRNFIEPRRDEALMASWQDFRYAIRHKTRYVFWQRPRSRDDDLRGAGEIPPEQILQEVGELISKLGLVRRVGTSEFLWRARIHDRAERVGSAASLGTIPLSLCKQSNRMSPAGIPMFYGALSAETALKEALVRPGHTAVASVGAFTCSREIDVVDFTDLPAVPTIFHPELGSLRRPIQFLHAFVYELAQDVRPTYEEIDYVPTQVITEYLLHAWDAGRPISGLKYPSARTGTPCVVLNIPSEHCLELGSAVTDKEALHLLLHPGTVSRQPLPASRRPLRERYLHSPRRWVRQSRTDGRDDRH